jgi:hypothetical protein
MNAFVVSGYKAPRPTRVDPIHPWSAVAGEEPPHRAAATSDPSFAHRCDDLVERHVRLWAISPSRKSACFSNGEMLPPLDFAATLPVSSKRCTQITTTLGLSP